MRIVARTMTNLGNTSTVLAWLLLGSRAEEADAALNGRRTGLYLNAIFNDVPLAVLV